MATRYTPKIVTDGLVLCLDAGNPKSYPGSGTAWADLTKNGNNGTITTAFYNSNNSGNLAFSGDLYPGTIPYTTALDPTGGLTIEAWVFPIDITTNPYYEIYRKEASPGRQLFSFQDYGTILSFGTDTTGNGYTEQDVSITAANYINQWVHLVASYTSGSKTVYRNGIPINKVTNITGTLQQGNATFFIGSSAGGENFKGNYSSLKIYNRRLTDSEVLQNYNATKSRYVMLTSNILTSNLVLNLDASNLLSYYGASTTWKDLGSGANNGTLTNGPTFSTTGGGSIVFDGSDDSVVLGSTVTLSNSTNWTISAAIYTIGWAGDFGNVFSNNSGGPVSNAMGVINTGSGAKIVYNYYDGAWQTKLANTSLSLNTWYYITWAMSSNNTIIMYLNGIADSSSTTGYGGPVNAIGRNWYSYFSGRIANLSYYNTNLTAAQILSNFNAVRGKLGI